MTVLIFELGIIAVLVLAAYLVVHCRRLERERRARRDARFALRVCERLSHGARVRPKADGRIQRRRYAR